MAVPMKVVPAGGEIIESVLLKGDLASLTPSERTQYYLKLCHSIGLNPLTKPMEYITLNGKLTLYAKRDATDQLRKINNISLTIVSQDASDGLLTVHVRAKDGLGREDEDLGVVAFPDTLKGEARANAILKAVTKAKRRVTLSISGLGFLDDTEIADIPANGNGNGKRLPPHNPQTGEITEDPPLTEEQADDLRDLAMRCQARMDVFLDLFHVESIEQIPQSQYARARQKLNAKLALIQQNAERDNVEGV